MWRMTKSLIRKLQSHGIIVLRMDSLFPIADTFEWKVRTGRERPSVLFYKASALYCWKLRAVTFLNQIKMIFLYSLLIHTFVTTDN